MLDRFRRIRIRVVRDQFQINQIYRSPYFPSTNFYFSRRSPVSSVPIRRNLVTVTDHVEVLTNFNVNRGFLFTYVRFTGEQHHPLVSRLSRCVRYRR